VFLSVSEYAVSKVTTSVRSAVFQPWHEPAIVLPLVYCAVDDTLFKLSPESAVYQVATDKLKINKELKKPRS